MQKKNRIFICMKKPVLFFLLLQSAFAHAGGDVKIKGRKFILLPFVSGIWQKAPFGDIAIGHPINIHYANGHFWHTTIAYAKLGAEFKLTLNHPLVAPKISPEIDYKYFCFRGNVEDYFGDGKGKFYVTPELGLTLAGFISVTGGYNAPLSNNTDALIPPYRVSLSLMLPFAISGRNNKQKK
jgi:hypothetical protein